MGNILRRLAEDELLTEDRLKREFEARDFLEKWYCNDYFNEFVSSPSTPRAVPYTFQSMRGLDELFTFDAKALGCLTTSCESLIFSMMKMKTKDPTLKLQALEIIELTLFYLDGLKKIAESMESSPWKLRVLVFMAMSYIGLANVGFDPETQSARNKVKSSHFCYYRDKFKRFGKNNLKEGVFGFNYLVDKCLTRAAECMSWVKAFSSDINFDQIFHTSKQSLNLVLQSYSRTEYPYLLSESANFVFKLLQSHRQACCGYVNHSNLNELLSDSMPQQGGLTAPSYVLHLLFSPQVPQSLKIMLVSSTWVSAETADVNEVVYPEDLPEEVKQQVMETKNMNDRLSVMESYMYQVRTNDADEIDMDVIIASLKQVKEQGF